KPVNMRAIFWPTWRIIIGAIVLAAVASVVWHRHARRGTSGGTGCHLPIRRRLSGAMIQCCQLAAIALFFGISYHLFANEGLLVSSLATDNVVRAHGIGFLDKLDTRQVQRAMERNAVIIDARYPQDYQAAHIAGAINVGVSTDLDDRHKAVAHIPKGSRIVLYCQSNKCPYAGHIAGWLLRQGYTNIALYPGGWMEWVKSKSS
ncbi:MAG: rhodanese-like domain-containing protein, partial [Planctomycetota bacterium]|nr:rhodanese-like domain-containing protein [Planctomycetota bacterium]